jgi:hypothetical protein
VRRLVALARTAPVMESGVCYLNVDRQHHPVHVSENCLSWLIYMANWTHVAMPQAAKKWTAVTESAGPKNNWASNFGVEMS